MIHTQITTLNPSLSLYVINDTDNSFFFPSSHLLDFDELIEYINTEVVEAYTL